MDIRPQDLPELRAELVRMREAVGPEGIRQYQPEDTLSEYFDMAATDLVRAQTYTVSTATLFHVAREMTELARAAATTLPMFVADREDFPAEAGLVYFDGGVWADWSGKPVHIHVASWQVLAHIGVIVSFYANTESARAAMPYPELTDAVLSRHGAPQDGIWYSDLIRVLTGFNSDSEADGLRKGGIVQEGIAATMMPVLRAALLLMQQPLAEVSDVQPDRAAKKRLRRAGHEPAAVRVIELRRPKTSSGHGEGDREYHHQWIVRGHWRQHWYPKREVHRPVWIAPHVKGPEGAPLIGGEKVYAWKR